MRPRPDEVLTAVSWSFETYIMPDLRDGLAVSMSYTIRNLLNHVRLAIQKEGPALWEDNKEIRALLKSVKEFLATGKEEGSTLASLSKEIDEALAKEYRKPDEYPTIASLIDEATGLRWVLVHIIETLDRMAPAFNDKKYQKMRDDIRLYLRHELEREVPYIAEAFSGRVF